MKGEKNNGNSETWKRRGWGGMARMEMGVVVLAHLFWGIDAPLTK